ncbi:MAG: hypothetical protein COB02_07020 [Candidatus Cloacimonadota bacterium]|nr:MAG: hypothetical protein COB02_07020 [Candidatus Cloacimonadota bacterium]
MVQRNIKIFNFLILNLLLTSISFSAGWSREILNHSDKYDHPFANGFAATLSSICHKPNIKEKNIIVPILDWKFKIDDLLKDPLTLKVALQQDSKGNVKKAPLLFYIPGAFSNLGNGQSRRWMDEGTRLGYHVITPPNPWGTDYVGLKPKAKLGDVEAEGKVIYNAFRQAFKKLNDKHKVDRSKIRIAGVSAGSFLTAIISALDAKHNDPIGFYDSTIMSAPFNFGRTLDRLDKIVLESKEPFMGMSLVSVLIRFKRFCRAEKSGELNDYHLESAKGLTVYQGFHSELIKSIKVYDKVNKLNSIPGGILGSLSPKYKKWKRKMNFNKFFDVYAPETKKLLLGNNGDLLYWVNQAKKSGYDNFRILNADDDFLNANAAWANYMKRSQDLIMLQDGGHYGFRHLDWFKEFISLSFSLTSKTENFNQLYK